MLQRAVGNRAAGRLLRITPAPPARVQRGKHHPDVKDSGQIKGNKLAATTEDRQKTVTLIKGHTYSVMGSRGTELKIWDDDDAAYFWVDATALGADQKSTAAGPVTTAQQVNASLSVFMGQAGNPRDKISLPKGYEYVQTTETQSVSGIDYVKIKAKGLDVWVAEADLRQDQGTTQTVLNTTTAPTDRRYPDVFQTRYGYAQAFPPDVTPPSVSPAGTQQVQLNPGAFKAKPNKIGVLPGGDYLWGRVTVQQQQFAKHDFVPETPWRAPVGIPIANPVPDGNYWLYEEFDDTFTTGAEAEHNGDFTHAFNLTYGALQAALAGLAGRPLPPAGLAARLLQALPQPLQPPGKLAGQTPQKVLDQVLAQTKDVWDKLARFSGYFRDVELYQNNEPSHGTIGYQANLRNGHLVLTRQTNALRGPFKAPDYLSQGMAWKQ